MKLLSILFVWLLGLTQPFPLNRASDITPAKTYIVREIVLSGNKITHEQVIINELPVHKGDTVSEDRVAKILRVGKENLLNLSLFNYVDIRASVDGASLILNIQVEERWYIWPMVSIKLENRNFSSWLKDWDLQRITVNAGVKIDNLFGMNHDLIVSGTFGFSQGFNLTYRNISLDNRHRHLLSFSFNMLMSNSIDVTTYENKPVHFKKPDGFVQQEVFSGITYIYRPNLRSSVAAEFTHTHAKLSDTLLWINPNYWGTNRTELSAFRFKATYTIDQRDYHPYPIGGYLLQGTWSHYITDDRSVYYTQFSAVYRLYSHLSERWSLANFLNGAISFKNREAWILDRAIGYEANLRGYEYYVADGQAYLVSNNAIRYNILPKKVITLKRLNRLHKFNKIHFAIYANAHLDIGYAWNRHPLPGNDLCNQLLYGAGAGLDIVTYYDIVLGCHYSINKQGKCGFYFTLNIPFM